jgi:hypothetical protein
LKKASSDLQQTTSFHLEGTVVRNIDERPALRRNTRAMSLQKGGKTALFGEMPRSIHLTSLHSRHQSRIARKIEQRMLKIWPMRS